MAGVCVCTVGGRGQQEPDHTGLDMRKLQGQVKGFNWGRPFMFLKSYSD